MKSGGVVLCTVLVVVGTSRLFGGIPAVYPTPVAADSQLSSRIAVSAGMGVEYFSAPNVVDFINGLLGGSTAQRIPEFKSAIQFFGAVSYPVSTGWVLKGEYVYLLCSYNPNVPGASDFSLTVNMPSVILQRVLWDERLYNIKVGAGLGYHFASLTVKYSTVDYQLSGKGLGAVLEAEASTAFGDHLFAYLGCDARFEFVGRMQNGTFRGPNNVTFPKGNGFGVGARFGFSYYF